MPQRPNGIAAQQRCLLGSPMWNFSRQSLGFRVRNYGMTKWSDLFTSRQLVALTTFSDLVLEARDSSARRSSLLDCRRLTSLKAGGTGATAYAEAIAIIFGICLSRLVQPNNRYANWTNDPQRSTSDISLPRQAIPMVWDFAEANPFARFSRQTSEVRLTLIRKGSEVVARRA